MNCNIKIMAKCETLCLKCNQTWLSQIQHLHQNPGKCKSDFSKLGNPACTCAHICVWKKKMVGQMYTFIYDVFNNYAVGNSTQCRTVGKLQLPNMKFHPRICLEGLRKTGKFLTSQKCYRLSQATWLHFLLTTLRMANSDMTPLERVISDTRQWHYIQNWNEPNLSHKLSLSECSTAGHNTTSMQNHCILYFIEQSHR